MLTGPFRALTVYSLRESEQECHFRLLQLNHPTVAGPSTLLSPSAAFPEPPGACPRCITVSIGVEAISADNRVGCSLSCSAVPPYTRFGRCSSLVYPCLRSPFPSKTGGTVQTPRGPTVYLVVGTRTAESTSVVRRVR